MYKSSQRGTLLSPLTTFYTAPKSSLSPLQHLSPSIVSRHAHLLRLHDIFLHLLSLPPSPSNSVRTLRAWRCLCQCKEFDLSALWRLGAAVIARMREEDEEDENEDEERLRRKKEAEWIKFVQSQKNKLDLVDKFVEYELHLIAAGRIDFALEEMESFLPSYPYHDSITLTILAGLLCLWLSQPPPSTEEEESSSSSDDLPSKAQTNGDSSGSDSDDEPRTKTTRPRKRRASFTEVPLSSLFSECASNSPTLFSKAKEYFRRASRLEQDSTQSRGEGQRWLEVLEFHEERPRKHARP